MIFYSLLSQDIKKSPVSYSRCNYEGILDPGGGRPPPPRGAPFDLSPTGNKIIL